MSDFAPFTKKKTLFRWDSEAEMDLLRHLGRTDFWTYFCHVFGAAANPKGKVWIDPEVHEPIAHWFQHHVDEWFENRKEGRREQKHLAVLVHREVGKTTMITQAGLSWIMLRDPELSIYIGSERTELSMKMLGGIKAILDGSDPYSLFTQLYGNWQTGARTWTGKEIVHSARKNTARRDPSFGTYAVETSIVGAHPDILCKDDPNSYERMMSDTNWFQAVNSQVTSELPVIQADGLVIWPGTRYGDDDHYGTAFAEEGVASISGMESESISVTEGGKWHVYFLAGRDGERSQAWPIGKPTTPKVWTDKRLRDFQRRDPLRYAAQVMNDPSISEFNPLTKEQISQCMVKPDQVPWNALRFAICCDTALWDGKSRVSKDETVMIVHGYPRNGSGDVYIIEGYGSPLWRAEDFGQRLVTLVQRYRRLGRKVFRITDEVTMAGKKGAWSISLQNMFNDHNEPMPGGRLLEFERGGAKKVQRMIAAASFWVDGHVRVVEGAPGVDRLCEQMSKLGQYMVNPKIKIDWADAHSDAFQKELYQPMRRNQPGSGGYLPGATAINAEGIDSGMWGDDEARRWKDEVPREPI